jgi:DNA-binding transcriptional regulator LsrR (DeoR family)
MKDAAVGELGGMFLKESGVEEEPDDYVRIGISYSQLRDVAQRGGAILMTGIQRRRLGPVLAALRGGLVSAFVTDLGFASSVLNAHANATI